MPNPFETSFIPQQPLLKVEGVSRRAEPVNVALITALVIFFVTAILGGALYYWKLQVVKTVEAKGLELQEAEKYFRTDDIDMYKRLQVSLDTARQLVDEHTIFSVVFDLIEERAAKNIGLTSLSYTQEAQEVVVLIGGQAPSYTALYFQVDTWRNMAPVVRGVELVNFVLRENSGVVEFTARVIIDPSYLKSAQVIKAEQQEQIEEDTASRVTPTNPPQTVSQQPSDS